MEFQFLPFLDHADLAKVMTDQLPKVQTNYLFKYLQFLRYRNKLNIKAAGESPDHMPQKELSSYI